MPAWVDFKELVYGVPDLEGRGFKLAIDAHGPPFDPDAGERLTTAEGLTLARAHLARLLPGLRAAPVVEARVCQYENTPHGDFLIDRHPEFENVWLVGGGSGHGFKHGPALGEYVAGKVTQADTDLEPRFALSAEGKARQRLVY
jgi:glycine/D-amino acid oxidase-like deaminating enzyme